MTKEYMYEHRHKRKGRNNSVTFKDSIVLDGTRFSIVNVHRSKAQAEKEANKLRKQGDLYVRVPRRQHNLKPLYIVAVKRMR